MTAERKRKPIGWGRWLIFGIMIGLIAATLFAMIWTGEEGRAIRIRLPDSGTDERYFFIASAYGHLELGMETVPARFMPTGPRSRPLVSLIGYWDPYIVDDGISYTWLLSAECLALFFLVPSILSGRKTANQV